MEDNPYFHNALALDLYVCHVVSEARFRQLLRDPMDEARKYEKDNLTIIEPARDAELCQERVRIWQREYSTFNSRVCKRWPHPIYPPLPRGTDMSVFAVEETEKKKVPKPPSAPPPYHIWQAGWARPPQMPPQMPPSERGVQQ